MKSSDIDAHKFSVRFTSIEVDYKTIVGMPAFHRIINLNECAIRVDIYNSMSFGSLDFFKNFKSNV
jgi:hypothetical protein